MSDPEEVARIARGLRQKWDVSPYHIHKRPPFRAHSFDGDGRFWVVGSTSVSVLNGAHGNKEWAEIWADAFNRTHLMEQNQ